MRYDLPSDSEGGYPHVNKLIRPSVERFAAGRDIEWQSDTTFSINGEPYRVLTDKRGIDIVSARYSHQTVDAMRTIYNRTPADVRELFGLKKV